MSDDQKNFISSLLHKDPLKRLGRTGPQEIMQHPWFKNLDFNKLIKKEIKAPYMPECKTAEEIKADIKNKPEAPAKLRESRVDPKIQSLIKKNEDKFAKF